MSGYWIVMAMLLVALICVVIAAASENPDHPTGSDGDSLLWVVLGDNHRIGDRGQSGLDGWTKRVVTVLSPSYDLRVEDLTQPGSRIAQALGEQVPAAVGLRPTLVTAWFGVNDLIGGVPLEEFERDLRRMVTKLQATGAHSILGNLPRDGGESNSETRHDDTDSWRHTIDRWNAAIARIGVEHGVEVVDLSDAPTGGSIGEGTRPDDESKADLDDHWLSERFRPAIERALAAAATSPAAQSEPGSRMASTS